MVQIFDLFLRPEAIGPFPFDYKIGLLSSHEIPELLIPHRPKMNLLRDIESLDTTKLVIVGESLRRRVKRKIEN